MKNFKLVHTTPLGVDRIRKNLNLEDEDVVAYCIEVVRDEKSVVEKKGKNYYVYLDNEILTINSNSYTIITAHTR